MPSRSSWRLCFASVLTSPSVSFVVAMVAGDSLLGRRVFLTMGGAVVSLTAGSLPLGGIYSLTYAQKLYFPELACRNGFMEGISPFDPQLIEVKTSPFIICLGKRRSGKSWAIRYLLSLWHEHFDRAVLSSRTERLKKFLKGIFPTGTVFNHFEPRLLERIIETQSEDVAVRGKGNHTNLLCLFDDVLGDGKSVRCNAMTALATEGRHLGITTVVACQYPLAFTPAVRTNADWVLEFSEVFYTSRKRMFANFSGVFRSFREWEDVFEKVTASHGVLVLKTSENETSAIQGNVFSWRAPAEPPAPLRIGSDAFGHIATNRK